MLQQLVANLYNPHEQTKEQLIESFVVRCKLFQQLFQEITTADMRYPQQHYLIEGQRGSGKTTLLLRLSYEIENNVELRARLILVVLKEEAYYGITRLFKLWEKIAQALESADPQFKGLYDDMTRAYTTQGEYERECFQRLMTALEQAGGKKIILFLDNLGEMFRNFNDQESHRLREILMTCPHLRIIGATAVVLEAFFKYEHAFYEFFKTRRLEGLNQAETRALLLQLAKTYGKEKVIKKIIKEQPRRIESLRILTGGVIRTIVLLFEIFIDHENGNAISDLDLVLDRVTPLYKHRMDDLQPLQREVVEALALRWDATSPEDVAQTTRHDLAEVNTLLAQLEKVFIIQRVATPTTRDLYCLQERFFNIWYLMRLAAKGSQQKVLWLVRFLECWYNPQELVQRAKAHLRAIKIGGYHPKAAYYLTEALGATRQLDRETEYKLVRATRAYLQDKAQELAADLSPADQELFETGEEYYQHDEYEKAIEQLLQIKSKDAAVYYKLGYASNELKQYDEAVKYYSMAADLGDVGAMVNLGALYQNEHKDVAKAEQYYLMSVEQGDADAMVNLGVLYYNEFKDVAKAEQYWLMAVERGDTDAMNNLGGLFYHEFKDVAKAEQYCLMAVEHGDADAMNNLAWLYFEQKIKKEDAVRYAQKSVEQEKDILNTHTLACVLVWHHHYEEAVQIAKEFIGATDIDDGIIRYLMLLLAHAQYPAVAAYFDDPALNFRERFKPLYYALLSLTNNPDAAKMPPELAEPVADVLKQVTQMAEDYQ